ncbi:TonB-dependent receptor plug domain-containing protein [Altererythrobacter sp. Z27]|uniref:TonB-dependent receptor plug domain-containing protein n=1 Tax=Altererythrobacter sp. Z27 TaxID=3461147 RepID=UPI004043D0BE
MSSRLVLHSTCACAAIAFASLSSPALAQDASGQGAESGDQPVIIVTGTRRTDRTVADSTVPIDVIGAEALLNQGSTETNRLLNNLVPSFNFPQPSLTDGTDSLRPATLRGLSPDQVLVLVNGKRRHISSLLNLNGSVGRGSAGVDMNTIPPLAIERIEVLRDGASSQYGSDAIAGVINIQIKKREGGRAQMSFGKYITTMEDVYEIDSVTGTTGNSDDPVVTFSDRERKRRDGDTWTFATNIGLPVGDSGYLNWTAEYKDRSPSNRSGPDIRRQYVTAGDPREVTFNRFSHRFGDGESKDLNFFVNAGMDVGADFELYAFGSYGQRDGNGTGFYRRSNDARNRDWAASTTTFVPFYPDGFLPQINSDIEDIAGVFGVRGETGGWNLDLSVNYGSNRLDYAISNTWNVSLGGLVSPRKFDAGGLRSGQTSVNFDAQRPIELGIGESSLAFGAEWRNENYKIRPGEEGSYIAGPYTFSNGAAPGAQVFPGFAPSTAIDKSRDSYAAYVELDTDLSDMFNIQIAGRYEHFSDFGDTLNGKAAARLEPIDGLAFRGSVSTGFRAPGMAQQFFSTTSTNNIQGVGLVEVGTFPVSSPIAVALGAEPLQPEESVNFSGGVVFSMVPGLNVTVDYYNIKIKDRIVLTENLQGADVVAILQAAGVVGTSGRFFINGIDTRTEGLDIVGSYRLPDFGIGRLTLTAGYNINSTDITDRRTFSGFAAQRLFARPESFRLTDGQPKNKLNLGLEWDNDPFGATLRANRYGSVFLPTGSVSDITVAKGAATGDFTMTPKWVVDFELRFKPVDSVQLAVGANNLLDEYPDRLVPTGSNIFLPYSGQSPFGFSGRFVYGRASIDF